ncbi:hypothetical protein [Bacillus rhizoplanae]|uniref:hypothetical protein n=1 Tax=Bacillus rhizoplanae TaxID=2880966 RepID=UPI003D1EE56C
MSNNKRPRRIILDLAVTLDGFIGWRTKEEVLNPELILEEVMNCILCNSSLNEK